MELEMEQHPFVQEVDVEADVDNLKEVQASKNNHHIMIQMDMKMYNNSDSGNFIIISGGHDSTNFINNDFLPVPDNKINLSSIINFCTPQSDPRASVSYADHGNDQTVKDIFFEENIDIQTSVTAGNFCDIDKNAEESSYLQDYSKKRYEPRGKKDISFEKTDFITSSKTEIGFTKQKDEIFSTFCDKFKAKSFLDYDHESSLGNYCSSEFSETNYIESNKEVSGLADISRNSPNDSKKPCDSVFTSYKSLSSLFKCEECQMFFKNKNKFNDHKNESMCNKSVGYTCNTCKRTFSEFCILKDHILMHLGKKCCKCNEFLSSDGLHNCIDLGMKWKFDPLQAKTVESKDKQCNNSFQHHNNDQFSFKNNTNSYNASHPSTLDEDNIGKETVGNILSNKNYLGLQETSCKNSKMAIDNESSLNNHLSAQKCMSNEKLKYDCDICGEKFSRLSKLQMHIINIHQKNDGKCEQCDMNFSSQSQCDKHHAKNCKTELSYSCKICSKIFSRKYYLKKHECLHSKTLFKCKFCHAAFMKEKSYKRHVEKMNCSKKARKIRLAEFDCKKCRICTFNFEDEDLLIKHFAADHPGENPHQCFCCDLCLPNFRELEHHIHLHNVQKFTCNICSKPYTSQEGLRKHRLTHKRAEFKCKFCESQFQNESRFKFHVKICKKNPESFYHSLGDMKNKKESPKQSRQLHWESRIIMKRLRGDPHSTNKLSTTSTIKESSFSSVFFDEPDTDSSDSNVRGWFDDYYKTEEDDLAFGLVKQKTTSNQCSESVCNGNEPHFDAFNNKHKNKLLVAGVSDLSGSTAEATEVGGMKNDINTEHSFDDSSEDSYEEEFPDELDFTLDYNPKKCRICMIVFSQEYELLHHFIKVHPEKRAHKCPNCDVECPLFAQLKEHLKAHGIGMGVYNCDNCSKKFRSEKKMKNHNVRCKGLEPTLPSRNGSTVNAQFRTEGEDYCKRCCKKFQTKCGYRRHKQLCKKKHKNNEGEDKKTGESPTKSNVTAITQTNNDQSNNKNNTKVDLNPSADPPSQSISPHPNNAFTEEPPMDSFPCRLCDKKFQYERGVVMHFKADHPGHKPLVCHICSMHLADKLKEHLKTHGIGEEFICELCGKRFNQKFLSKIHEMWHQGIEYKCNNCKQKFLNKEKMEKHINENRCSNRQSLMRLPCDICGKSYRSKFGLSKHHITHTPKELRPVKNRMNCEFCGKWFENNNGLQRHRRIHTGERPFCCRFCSKAFAQEGNCKAHERIHTGESKLRKKKNVVNGPAPCIFEVKYMPS